MSPADFNTLLRARPFVPFRVVTSDGTIYEVRHPEMALLALASVVIGYPDERLPYAAGRYDIVSMRHIVRLEPAPPPTAQAQLDGNGQQG